MPAALATEGPHGRVVHAANRLASLAGVVIGARVVDMQTLCPGLRVEHVDTRGDLAALGRLALWARRWCPWTAADGADGLILDTSGADHLWGGEAAMLEQMEADFSAQGLSARVALASTRGAAWALARFGAIRPVSFGPMDLAPLPVAALRLGPETVRLLDRLGLKRIGDLMEMPRAALARRFTRTDASNNPLIRLDQATGRLDEPVAGPEAPPVFRVTLRLAEPILDPVHHLPDLCRRLRDKLDVAEVGARRLVLNVFRTDAEMRQIAVGTALPIRDPDHMIRLFSERIERLDPGFGFDLIVMEATRTDPLRASQTGLDGTCDNTADFAQLVDRLTARFGPGRIFQTAPRASHIPERSQIRIAPLAVAPSRSGPVCRPLRVFDPPEEIRVLYTVPEGPPVQFVWRRRIVSVVRYQGPERISPEWWHDRSGTRLRDYFRIEDPEGRRLWVYREGLADDERGPAPRWFLHGMFA